MVFLPLLGAILSGFFGKIIGVRNSEIITSFFVTNNTILRYLFKLSGRNLPRKISRESL